jgi:hypothetical protein
MAIMTDQRAAGGKDGIGWRDQVFAILPVVVMLGPVILGHRFLGLNHIKLRLRAYRTKYGRRGGG